MSEYKMMSEWRDEIGLVAGMKFENMASDFCIEIIHVVDVDSIKFVSNRNPISSFAYIRGFDYKYKLIYDPRSEYDCKKEVKMNLREQLKKNSEEYKRDYLKESKEYKDFSSKLTKELINFSKNSPAKQKIYVCYTRDQEFEVDMLKLFCDENGLSLNGWTIVWE